MADIKKIATQILDFINSGHSGAQYYLCERAVKNCIANKADLIGILSKHPNWDEDNLRIHFDADYVRAKNPEEANRLLRAIGCHITDSVDPVYDSDDYDKCIYFNDIAGHFYLRGNPLRDLGELLAYMENIRGLLTQATVSDVTERVIKTVLPNAHIHAGQKTTRAVFALLKQYGWQEALTEKNQMTAVDTRTGDTIVTDSFTRARQNYNDYTDAMNPLTITRHTVISVNPMDFLRMSYGNSWYSCHYIDDGKGCNDDGGWSAGCWSYAYDKQTMIFYTVDGDVDDEHLAYADKYTRQVFHWNGEALMPARLYPQKFDCSPDAEPYRETRAIVEKVMSDCLGIGNMWRKLSVRSYDANITSLGHHYRDYREMINAFIFAPSFLEYDETDEELAEFLIGSDDAICVCCGDYLDDSSYPICSSCACDGKKCSCCGDHDNDGEYVNGSWVCRNCLEDYYMWDELNGVYIREEDSIFVHSLRGRGIDGYTHESECGYGGIFYCEDCGGYFNSTYHGEYYTADGTTICERCFESYYAECPRCGEIYYKRDMVSDGKGEYICEDCITDDEFICAKCGELHTNDELAEELDGKKYCADCYDLYRHVCEECGVVFYTGYLSMALANPSKCVCDDCLQLYYDKTTDGRYAKIENVGLPSSEYIYGVRRWNGSTIELIHRNQLASLDLYEVFVPVEIIDEVFPMLSESVRSVMKSTLSYKLMKNGKYYFRCRVGEECRSEDGEGMVSYKNRYIAWFLANTEEEAA